MIVLGSGPSGGRKFPRLRMCRQCERDVTGRRCARQLLLAPHHVYHAAVVVMLCTWIMVEITANATGDEGFCQTRYLSSGANVSRVGSDAVGVAAILELRMPDGGRCGVVSGMNLQVAAALLWGVQLLNGDLTPQVDSFIPGVHLELRVYDDCSQEILAARQVSEVLNIHGNNCMEAHPPLAGVLGTSLSPTTTRVAGLLANTLVPQFGVSATLPELSDSALYPSFFRTVPSDLTQSKVVIQIVTRLKWTYIASIYTRDNYGTQGFQEFKRLAAEAGLCIFREKSFLHSDPDMENQMEIFIRMLLLDMVNTGSSLGVVYFGQSLEAARLFQMIQDRRAKWHDQQKLNQIHWLFSDGVGTSAPVARKAAEYTSAFLSISPASLSLPDFRQFFVDLLRSAQPPDPYWSVLLNEFVVEELPCDPNFLSTCNLETSLPMFDYLPAALDSLYSLAALVKRAHKELCVDGVPGLCPELATLLQNGLLKTVHPEPLNYSQFFTNDQLPEEFRSSRILVSNEYGDFVAANNPLYYISIARNSGWRKIGQYTNGSVTFDPGADFRNVGTSECRTACATCRKSDVTAFHYQPGDVLLVGMYSVLQPEAPTSFRCGQYRGQSSSVVASQAFLQALQVLARKEGGQPDVEYPRVGGLVLDDCYNSLTAVSLLSGLFSKKFNLTDSATGEIIDVDKVVAVVGSQSSTVTLSSLSVLSPLRIPTISYSASSPDLDDRVSYPYFSRTVPSDSVQGQALLELLMVMNVTYVGAFHQNNNYGIRGMQTFVSMAESAGICVEPPIPLADDAKPVELLSHLRSLGNLDVKVIVAFVTQPTAINILDAMQSYSVSFVFLASEAWGTGPATLQGVRGAKARGSLVLTVDTTREVGGVDMEGYLKAMLPPASITDHTWLRNMWEALLRCNLPGSLENAFPAACSLSARISDEIAKQLASDQKVVQTINAVYSAVLALRSECNFSGSQAAASDCAKNLDADLFSRAIRGVQLTDKAGQAFQPFLDSGNGNTGFTVYNVQKTNSGYTYVKVGNYDPSTGLNVRRDDMVFYNQLGQPQNKIDASCAHKDQCRAVCIYPAGFTPRPGPIPTPAPQREDGKGPLVAAVGVLGALCLLLLLLVAAGVLLVRRGGAVKRKLFGRFASSNGGTHSGDADESRRESGVLGRVNSAFTPTSPRVSLPLPPVPGPKEGDYDRCSCSSPSPTHICPASRDSTVNRRVRTSAAHLGHLERQQPKMDALQLRLQQRQEWEDNLRGIWPDPGAPGRPRVSSSPRAVRPNFLPLRPVTRTPDNHSCSSECLGTGSASQKDNFRPRAWSEDAAAGSRLGALSELDRQLLVYFVNKQRQQQQQQQMLQNLNVGAVGSSVSDTSDPVRRQHVTAMGVQFAEQQRRQGWGQHGAVQASFPLCPGGGARPGTPASREQGALWVSVPAGACGGVTEGLYLHPIPSCNSSLYLHAAPEPGDTQSSESIANLITTGHATAAQSDPMSPRLPVTSPVSSQSDASNSVFDSPPEVNDVTGFFQPREDGRRGGVHPRATEVAQGDHQGGATTASVSADAAMVVARFSKEPRDVNVVSSSPLPASAVAPPDQQRLLSPEMLQQFMIMPPSRIANVPGEVNASKVMPVLVSPTGSGSSQYGVVYVPCAIVPQNTLGPKDNTEADKGEQLDQTATHAGSYIPLTGTLPNIHGCGLVQQQPVVLQLPSDRLQQTAFAEGNRESSAAVIAAARSTQPVDSLVASGLGGRAKAPNKRPRLGTGMLGDPRFSGAPTKSSAASQEGRSAQAAEVASCPESASPPATTAPTDIVTSIARAASSDSLPYIQGYQLIPVPPHCGPVSTEMGGNSNGSSAHDSGTGEDLPAAYLQDGEVVVL